MQIKKYSHHKAQSTLEYAILVVIVIGVLLAMQVYVKRGLQGRLKSSTDDIGEQYSVGAGGSFNKTTRTQSKVVENSKAGTTNTDTKYANTTTNVLTNWKTTEEFFLDEGQAAPEADEN